MSDLRHVYEGKISAEILDAVDRLFKARPWRDDEPGRLIDRYQRCVNRICEHLGAVAPIVQMDPNTPGLGQYLPGGVIMLEKWSVTTLLHLLRIHLYHVDAVTDPEVPVYPLDAAAWSLSIFHQTRPEYLQTAIDRGRIVYIQPALVGADAGEDIAEQGIFAPGSPNLN